MNKYISIEIPNKDCKGMFLECNTELKKITSIQEANKLIGKIFKIQLRTRVNGRIGKKIFTFENKKSTFLRAIEYIASKRSEIRETLKEKGTLRKEKKVVESDINSKEETFLDCIDLFLETKEISARKSTIQNYSTALRIHSKPLHNKQINNITIKDIQKIINNMLQNRADATVVLFARTLRAFLSKQKAKIVNQWEDLSLPHVDNKVDYVLGLEDTKKIIYAMKNYSLILIEGEAFYQFEEIRNIFLFLLTGRRINEILQLKYSDINFEAKTFKIPASTAKSKKELVFNLDDSLLEAIESQARLNNVNLKDKLRDQRIFSYTKETPRVHFQNLLKALNLPKLRLHDIRHMIATTLVQNEVAIADISVLLGHSSISITEARYANKSKDQASRALNALDVIIDNKN